jgi:hypothetical protein
MPPVRAPSHDAYYQTGICTSCRSPFTWCRARSLMRITVYMDTRYRTTGVNEQCVRCFNVAPVYP